MTKSMRELLNKSASLFEDYDTLITTNGHTYEVFLYTNMRGTEVEVYPRGSDYAMGNISFISDSETTIVRYFDENGNELEDFSNTNSDLYHQHIAKSDEELAHQIGTWIVNTHPENG